MPYLITSLVDLEALYGEPNPASLLKETDRVTPEYRAFIEAAPFTVLATAASARVFRATLLLYGMRPGVRQIVRAIFSPG